MKKNQMKRFSIVGFSIIILFTSSLFFWSNAKASIGIVQDGIPLGSSITYEINKFPGSFDYEYRENWKVIIDGANAGQMALLVPPNEDSSKGRTLAHADTLYAWGNAMGGNPYYVRDTLTSGLFNVDVIRKSDRQRYIRYWSRDIAQQSGAYLNVKSDASGQGYLEVQKTPFPTGNLSVPQEAKTDSPFDISFNAMEYEPFKANKIEWKILVNGSQKASGVDNLNSISNKKVPITIYSEGQYTVDLIVTDAIQRSKTISKSITVKKDVSGPIITPEPEPNNEPPTVSIQGPNTVVAGEEFCLEAEASDIDGTIEGYQWDFNGIGTIDNSMGCGLYYTTWGKTETVTTTVVDDKGASGFDDHNIKVLAPTPSAKFSVSGALKENRKIILKDESTTPIHFPIVKASWKIESVDNPSTVIKTNADLTKSEIVAFLVKKEGTYKITRTVENSAGLEGTSEQTINVAPDQKPTSEFSTVTSVFRDIDNKNDEGMPLAKIQVTNQSKSLDGDVIQYSIYSLVWDSNNDGIFNDGTLTINTNDIVKGATNKTDFQGMEIKTIIDEKQNLTMYAPKVGNWKVELEAVESFGQPTIKEFISESDYQRNNTDNKALNEKKIKIKNLAPNVSFGIESPLLEDKKDIVDLQIVLDDTTYSENQVMSEINNSLVPKLNTEGITSNISVKQIKENTSSRSIAVGRFHSLFILENNDIYGTGYNYNGTLGTGNNSNTTTPVKMLNPWGNIKPIAVSGGNAHSLILLENGDIYGTGLNYNYQLGNSNNSDTYIPTKMLNPWGSIKPIQIEATASGSIILLENGDVYVAGRFHGGTQYNTPTKLTFPWGNTKVVSVSANERHTLFLLENGDIYGMGVNNFGELGNGTNGSANFIPEKMEKTWGMLKATSISAGGNHSLILLENGETYATGLNDQYQLADGMNYQRHQPVKTLKPWGDNKVVGVSAGLDQSFFILENGDIWKTNQSDKEINQLSKPWGSAKVTDMVSENHDLILLENQEVYSLRDNYYGQLGIGNNYGSSFPAKVINSWGNAKIKKSRKSYDSLWNSSNNLLFTGYIHQSEVNTNTISNQTLSIGSKFIGVGNSGNKGQMDAIINRNLEGGTFLVDSPLSSTIGNMADYIIEQFNIKKNSNEVYVTLDDTISYLTKYEDPEDDPKLQERWKYIHSPKAFENDMGLHPKNNAYQENPIEQFSKVGSYQPFFSAKDNPVYWGSDNFDNYKLWSKDVDNWKIYVHRKPVPEFSFNINSTTGDYSLINQAYDLDRLSTNIGFGGGIKRQSFWWKLEGETSWKEGLPSSPLNRSIYEVKNEVTDFQNRTESLTRTLDATGVNKPPVAVFEPNPKSTVAEENILFKNLSYDPNGDDMTAEWYYKVKGQSDSSYQAFDNGGKSNGEDVGNWSPTYSFLSANMYDIKLVVKDEFGLQDSTVQTVEVTPNNQEPIAGFTFNSPIYIGDKVHVISEASDPDGDKLTFSYKLLKPDGTNEIISNSNSDMDDQGNFSYTPGQVGDWYISQEVSDGNFTLSTAPQKLEVNDLIIKGSVAHTEKWRLHHESLENPSDVFYSGEKFLTSANVSDHPIKSVKVEFKGIQVDNVELSIEKELAPNHPIYNGEIYEPQMSLPNTKLARGNVSFLFTAEWENGTIRKDLVTVQIIDDVYKAYDFYRTN